MSASEDRIAELEAKLDRLKYLLSRQLRQGEELSFEAIVNVDGEALVNLRWDELSTQLPAEVARETALSLLRVAEWAEVDAAMFAALRQAEFDDSTIAGFMGLMRETRGGERHKAG